MKDMNLLIVAGFVGIALLAGGNATAQTAPAPASAASAPQNVPRFGELDTPGWPMMSREERADYGAAMATLKTRAECVGYMNKHFDEMRKRSLQRNLPLQGNARTDLCNVLPN